MKADVDVYWGVHFNLFQRKILSFFFCQKDSKIENTTVDALQPLLNMDKTNQISEKVTKGEARSVLMKRCSENMQWIYRGTTIQKRDLNKVANQLRWNHTSACVFSGKFPAYFQNTFSQERLWSTASAKRKEHLLHLKKANVN